MTDERDDSEPTSPAPTTAPAAGPEGVRIIGAEEARAAIESGHVQARLGDEQLRFGDVPPRPEAPEGRTVRFPLPDAVINDQSAPPARAPQAVSSVPPREIVLTDEPETQQSRAPQPAQTAQPAPARAAMGDDESSPSVRVVRPASPPPSETSGQVELPHWTEPPTGEVPRILPESEGQVEIEEAILDDGDDEHAEAWAALGAAPRFRDGSSDWDEEDFATTGELKDDAMNVGALAAPVDDDEEFEREVAARRRTTRRGGGARTASRRRSRPDAGVSAPVPGTAPSTAASVGAAAPASSGRNLPIAVATGAGIALVAVACMFLGPAWVAGLATIIVAIAALEMFEGLRRAGNHPATLLALLGSVALVLAAYNRGTAAYPVVLALVVFFTMIWYLAEVVHARPVPAIGSTLLGFCYVGLFGSFAGLLLAMPWQTTPNLGPSDGVGLILGLAICAVGSDVVAYFVGSRFGRTRIAPRISPHKTLEGLAAGWIASLVLAIVVVHLFDPWSTSWAATLALGVVVGVIAPLGDLFESMIKRDLGVKDLGTLLPGHGGVMDRFDGILVCLPAVYFLARIFFG